MVKKIAALCLAVLTVGCSGEAAEPPDLAGGDPASGRAVFVRSCAGCHGADALGTDTGPPLIDELYAPGHHSDGAFWLAVRTGVRQHHWDFGPMPAIPGVTDREVADIVAWVRGLQESAGF